MVWCKPYNIGKVKFLPNCVSFRQGYQQIKSCQFSIRQSWIRFITKKSFYKPENFLWMHLRNDRKFWFWTRKMIAYFFIAETSPNRKIIPSPKLKRNIEKKQPHARLLNPYRSHQFRRMSTNSSMKQNSIFYSFFNFFPQKQRYFWH